MGQIHDTYVNETEVVESTLKNETPVVEVKGE